MAEPQTQYSLKEPEKVLEQYQKTGDAELRNALVMHYSYIAKSVALQMRGITGGYAQVEDIVNEGILALMDCIDKYTPDKGMKFENYVYMRLKNATIDFVRKQDWVPRRVRRTAREVNTAYNELATKLMREPTNSELAEHMGVSEQTIQKHLSEMNAGAVLSFEELLSGDMHGSMELGMFAASGESMLPEYDLMQAEMRLQLAKAIEMLGEKERLVITLYYYERLKLHEIATIMGVSESRVSQTHSKAVLKMRRHLEAYIAGV